MEGTGTNMAEIGFSKLNKIYLLLVPCYEAFLFVFLLLELQQWDYPKLRSQARY